MSCDGMMMDRTHGVYVPLEVRRRRQERMFRVPPGEVK